VSLAAALEDVATVRGTKVCAVGRYFNNMTATDLDTAARHVENDGKWTDLHAALRQLGFRLHITTLNNHLSGRCGCATAGRVVAS
jgi:hypothetical protein